MFRNQNFVRALIGVLIALIGLLLTVIGFFSAKTYASIERLSIDVTGLRCEIGKLEASRVSRAEIREIVADYHNSHMVKNNER